MVRSTNDVDVASAALSQAYAELRLHVPRRAERFSMQLHSVGVADVQLAVLHLSTALSTASPTAASAAWLRTAPYPTYTVCFPVRGRVRATAGGSSAMIADGHGVTVCPDSGEVRVEYLSDDCRVFTVTIDRAALEEELALMLGHHIGSAIRFDLGLDVVACGSLRRSVALLCAELADCSAMVAQQAASHRLGRLVMSALLLGQPHPWSEALRGPAGFEGPRAIRAALAAIEERPIDLVTVADIAKIANLSVRALEDGFRRHVGATPMEHVRRVRMARAHDELVHAEPGATTAMAVAQRWGFTNYGRFAAHYRQRFGCSPSETLRGATGVPIRPHRATAGPGAGPPAPVNRRGSRLR